jgi:hypothetical protein
MVAPQSHGRVFPPVWAARAGRSFRPGERGDGTSLGVNSTSFRRCPHPLQHHRVHSAHNLRWNDDGVGDPDHVPPVASTRKRATVAWWVAFCGPVAVAISVGLAGIVADDGMAAVWTFTVGIWALTLTVGVSAAPSWHDAFWWLKALLGSFVAAGLGLVLLFGVSTVGSEVRKDLTTTATTATTTGTSTATSTTAP